MENKVVYCPPLSLSLSPSLELAWPLPFTVYSLQFTVYSLQTHTMKKFKNPNRNCDDDDDVSLSLAWTLNVILSW